MSRLFLLVLMVFAMLSIGSAHADDLTDWLKTTPYMWLIPWITIIITVCSALDASLPQPPPGSHALLPRKIISFIAMNFGNSKNADQPDLSTWIVRILQMIIANVPPSAIIAAQPGPSPAPGPPSAVDPSIALVGDATSPPVPVSR